MSSTLNRTCIWQSEDPDQDGVVNKINLPHRYKNQD